MSQQTKDVVEESPALPPAPAPARLTFDGKEHELPVIVGSEGEVGLDISQLRARSGAITFDPGYGNTGACESAITFIDGEAGILRYRGYPIEEIAGRAQFTEICYLLIYGHLPTHEELKDFVSAAGQYKLAAEATRFPADKAEYQAGAARNYMAAGKNAEAQAIWAALAKDETGPAAAEAKVRLGEVIAKPMST